MVIHVEEIQEAERYAPQSDFSICVHEFPRLVVEVCSDPAGSKDHWRMLVYGASIVRLANHILEEGEAQDFVLVAIYMNDTRAEFHLYQEHGTSKVSSNCYSWG